MRQRVEILATCQWCDRAFNLVHPKVTLNPVTVVAQCLNCAHLTDVDADDLRRARIARGEAKVDPQE